MKKFHVVFKPTDKENSPTIGWNCSALTIPGAIDLFYSLCPDSTVTSQLLAVYSLDDINELLAHQKIEFNTSTAKPEGEEDRNEADRLDTEFIH